MNVLFFSISGADKNSGGVQHVTLMLAEALKRKYDYKCFLSQKIGINTYDASIFDGVIEISKDTDPDYIRQFIIDNSIQRIIVQSASWVVKLYYEAIVGLDNCKIIFCYHSQPSLEYNITTLELYLTRVKYSKGIKRIKSILHCLLFPYEKYKSLREIRNRFNMANLYSDRILLLSEKCMPDYMQYTDDIYKYKVSAINNPSSFDLSPLNLKRKSKKVLIVARFEEATKKISLALRIWALIENDLRFKEWSLDIVGDGPDKDMYIKLSKELNLKKVNFLGFRKPEPYYEESSIFMMTSLCEGWPLTLNEAMQYGCVSLVFDSFASHSDIVQDGENGYIIHYNDLEHYAQRLSSLILDENQRLKMAENAIHSMNRFSIDKISNVWNSYLNNI